MATKEDPYIRVLTYISAVAIAICLFDADFRHSIHSKVAQLTGDSPAPKPTEQKPKAEIPDIFRTQLMKFLEDATKLNQMAEQGISYADLRAQLVNVKTSFDLLTASWPSGFSSDSKTAFSGAIEGWDLALDLWDGKINKADPPTEPNINGYQRYAAYAGDSLDSGVWTIVYTGKKYFKVESNIRILLGLGSKSFQVGRQGILAALQ